MFSISQSIVPVFTEPGIHKEPIVYSFALVGRRGCWCFQNFKIIGGGTSLDKHLHGIVIAGFTIMNNIPEEQLILIP